MMRRSIALGMMIVASAIAHGDESAAADTPLRPTYYTCVKASRGVTLALNNCIGDEHDFQDKRLNTAYQRLRTSLAPAQKTALRDEERAWIGARDKTCSADSGGGTASLLDSNQCQLDETAARAAVLEARMRR